MSLINHTVCSVSLNSEVFLSELHNATEKYRRTEKALKDKTIDRLQGQIDEMERKGKHLVHHNLQMLHLDHNFNSFYGANTVPQNR